MPSRTATTKTRSSNQRILLVDQNKPTNAQAQSSPRKEESLMQMFPPQKQTMIHYQIGRQASLPPTDGEQLALVMENKQDSPLDDEEEVEIMMTDEMKYAEKMYRHGLMFKKGVAREDSETAYQLFQDASQLGHIGAKEELATGHLFGVHLPVDFHQAETYFQEGVETGSSASHYGLYFMHSMGFIPNVSNAQALVHLTFAAMDGNPHAQMALANRYWRGINLDRNCELALTFYRQVAAHVVSKITSASGELVQRFRLSDLEEHPSRHPVLVDQDLFQQYQIFADRGDKQAQYSLGLLHYFRGINLEEASHYLHLAAENGNSHAWAYLGKLYTRNTSIEEYQKIAVKYFERAAASGNPIGQSGLGLAYYHGAGIEQSYEKALELFRLAANQSYGEAQLMMGIMHGLGTIVPRNDQLALKWFQAAARSGHILSYNNLGLMHATGTGVLRSCPIACDFYKNVAERGSWSQMFHEAFRLYRQGKIEEALKLYLYLAELGYEIAQSNVAYILDRLPNQLSNIYRSEEERYRKAFLYWHRAAVQGYQYAHIKLGDYNYYGLGRQLNYTFALFHYRYASEYGGHAQGTFNLGYMHEKGLGVTRDLRAAQRFYRMALERSSDAYYPAILALAKVRLEAFVQDLILSARFFREETINARHSLEDSIWDLLFITLFTGLVVILLRRRRDRAA